MPSAFNNNDDESFLMEIYASRRLPSSLLIAGKKRNLYKQFESIFSAN